MKSGVFTGMPAEEYHAFPAANNSGLCILKRSPAHYYAQFLDPNREQREATPAMRLGSAIHTAVLEPMQYEKRYVVMPEGLDRRTKEGKAKYAELEESLRTILSYDEYVTAARVAQRVRNHPSAGAIFESGAAEQSFLWEDAETGVQCKARLDWFDSESSLIADLKSTEDASYEAFQRSCMTYGYYRQAAWYSIAVRAVTGRDPGAFIFAAFEKTAPFECAFYNADEEMIYAGREEIRALLRVYAECLKKNDWPGYPVEIRPIGLPQWFLRRREQLGIMETY